MKVISWNVNSLRARLDRVVALLRRHEPDLLCLQETKLVDEVFPRQVFEQLGYHCSIFGQRTYNGVAVLSREAPRAVTCGFEGNPVPEEARAISVDLGEVRVIDLYVVNGQSVGSDKYQLKLAWLDAFCSGLARQHDSADPLIVLGDFNIAPEDRDVFDPTLWQGKTLCTDLERERLRRLLDWGLVDLLRQHHEEGGIYSWWDYRYGAFARNQGLRIDLILASAPLSRCCRSVVIDRDERKMTFGAGKASDHAPVIAVFDEGAG